MEFFDNLANKYYVRPKKVPKDSGHKKIDWEDFNWPPGFEIFHVDNHELKNEESKAFMSVI